MSILCVGRIGIGGVESRPPVSGFCAWACVRACACGREGGGVGACLCVRAPVGLRVRLGHAPATGGRRCK